MSEASTKTIIVDVKELSYKSEQIVLDLTRYLTEALPQIEVSREGNKLEIVMPINLSKKAIKLRIKKFLHKKAIKDDYRPISFKEGYIVKEKRQIQLAYY